MQIRKSIFTKHFLLLIVAIAFINVATAQSSKFKSRLDNNLSLFGALTLNNQSVNDAGINAPINYLFSSVNNNVFKPGYSGGFRYDGIYDQKHFYSVSFSVNRVSAGTFYKNKYTQAPFVDDFRQSVYYFKFCCTL
jgi:hypothetical protein